MDAREAAKHDDRARDAREHVTDVELHDLVAGAVPGVGDRGADRDARGIAGRARTGARGGARGERRHRHGVGRDAEVRVLERRVAQPVAEREEWLAGEVEVVVTATGRLVVVREWQLPFAHREGDRQSAGGILATEEHVGDGVAALLAGIPGEDDAADLVDPPRHRDRAATDDDDDRRRAGRGDGGISSSCSAGEREEGAIAELPFLDSCDDNRDLTAPRDRDGAVDRCAHPRARSAGPSWTTSLTRALPTLSKYSSRISYR